jgi:hypothetical protein
MDKLYQESLDDCKVFGPEMQGWVDAYNRARMEAQRRDMVASEARRNVENLDKVNTLVVDLLFPHMVELAVRGWDRYKGIFDTFMIAAHLEKEIIRKATVSNVLSEKIKANTQRIIANWINKVLDDTVKTVFPIQNIMTNIIKCEIMIQSNHRESLNKLLSIIREVVDADIYQLLSSKREMQDLIETAEKSKTGTMTELFISKVTDISLGWNVIRSTANARIFAYNLQIVTHLAKDIAQLIIKATKTEMLDATKEMELAAQEKEAADWALKATEADAELQLMISIEQRWIVLTLDNIQTAISVVESLFQADANHMGTTIQQQVSQESLTSLLEIARQMMDFQSEVARTSKGEMEAPNWTFITFRQAFTQHQLVTQVDARRKVIQTAEHIIRITRFLAKMDKTVDLARKIKEVELRLIQAREEMKRLTKKEDEIIDAKISTLMGNQIGNVASTPIISFLPRRAASNVWYPTKPAASFITPPSIATAPSSSSTVPNTTVASSGVDTTGKVTHPRETRDMEDMEVRSINEQIQTLNRTLNEYSRQLSFESGYLRVKPIRNQTGPGKEYIPDASEKINQLIGTINQRIEIKNQTLTKHNQRLTFTRKEGSNTFSFTITTLTEKQTTGTGSMFVSPCQSSNLPMAATVSASSPIMIVPIPTIAPAQVNTEQKTDTWEEQEEEKQMAAVLIGLLNETPPTVTVPSPTGVSLELPGMEKKQKKRKRAP